VRPFERMAAGQGGHPGRQHRGVQALQAGHYGLGEAAYKDPHLGGPETPVKKESKKEDIINRLKNENKPLVEIYSYCLMPNHFHLLLKQKADKGISKFLTLVQNGYAKYFNIKRRRSGSLFQDMFKAVRIETEERFVHTSRYIHLNPVTAYIIELEKLSSYPWSSFPEYVGVRDNGIVNSELILGIVGGKEKYREFVYNQVEYQRELSKIKHLLLENV